jgi:uncharacterized protein (DUF983 family)
MDSAGAREPVTVLLKRGVHRRCPRCGGRGLFETWFRLRDHCPTCGVRFAREEGFFIGALFVNMAVTEAVLFVWLAVAFLLTLPDAPITAIVIGVVAITVVIPLAFYPYSKTIWAAIHLAMEPLDPAEEADAAVWLFEQDDEASHDRSVVDPDTDDKTKHKPKPERDAEHGPEAD